MKLNDLSNKDLVQIYKLLKEKVDFLENEKNKLEELANERRNPKTNR